MRTKQRKLGLTLLSLVMAIALVLGVTSFASTVKAEDPVTTVTMQNGARLRVEEDAPALVYTATIENFDSALEYGMLLVEANNLVGVSDYVAELDAQTYQKVECAPYGTETKKITAYFDIAADKLITQYAGIAYIYNGETYVYTEVTNNNIRSVDYVAQMAYLKGDGDKDVLATFISCEISEDLYGVNAQQTANNEAIVDGTNTYLSIVVDNLNEAIDFYDGSTELSFRSSQPYAGGSIVKFDIYVPAEVNGRYWIQFGTTTSKNVVDFYGNPDITKKTAAGAWLTATCQLPEGEDTYYFYITANKGGWNDGADVHYELRLDNFVVTEPSGATFTQDFENGYKGGDDETTVNFTVRGNETKGIKVEDVVRCETFGGSITLGGAAPELAMKYVFNVGLDNSISFVSKEAFAGGSELSFYYFIPAGTPTSWWRVSYDTTQEIDFYHSPYLNLGATTGAWTLATVTLPAGGSYYVTITSEVSATNWKIEGENSYVLIDNFAVNGEVVEDFNHGVSRSIFEVRKPVAVMDSAAGEGHVLESAPEFKEDEYAAKLNYKAWTGAELGLIEFVTKEAYPSGTVVKFKYKTVNAPSNCWIHLSTCTNPEEASVYAEVSGKTNTSKWVQGLSASADWVEVTYTLTETAYVHFSASVGPDWADGYMLVDDFSVTVGGETQVDTFNDGLTEGLFNVNGSGVVELGEGYVEETFETGEYAAQINYANWKGAECALIEFVTKEAYPSGTVVKFKYKTVNAPASYWNHLATCTDPEKASVYAEVSGKANTSKWVHSLANTGNEWVEVTYTLTETAYLHFAGNAGSAWADGYMLVDDFSVTVGGETQVDTFSEGLTEGLFNVNGSGVVELGEGYVEETFEEANHSLKYKMNLKDSIAMSTKKSYPAGTVVSFKYFIPEGTTTSWWGWSVAADLSSASYYDTADHGFATEVGYWAGATFTTTSEGYIYFGFECGHWSANSYVLFDEFVIGEDSDNFNKGFEDASALFNVDKEIISLGEEGYVYVAPEFAVNFHPGDLSSNVSTPSFITATTYAGGGTVTLDYIIEGTVIPADWWALCWTTSNTQADIFAVDGGEKATPTNDGKTISKDVVGEWQTVTINIPEGNWYFYLAGNRYNWENAKITIDNVVIKDANGNVLAEEDFNDDDYGIFIRNRNSISKVNGRVIEETPDEEQGGSEPVEPTPEPEEPEEPEVTFESLIEAGTVLDYLFDVDARVFWTTFVELNANGLEGNQLLLNVNFDISYNGTRSFALVLDPTSFLYFDGENVSLYQDGALVSTIEDISSNVDLAIRADGALFVNANGEYVYMGTLDKDYLGTVGFVSLFGDGTFTISNLKLASVCAKAQA